MVSNIFICSPRKLGEDEPNLTVRIFFKNWVGSKKPTRKGVMSDPPIFCCDSIGGFRPTCERCFPLVFGNSVDENLSNQWSQEVVLTPLLPKGSLLLNPETNSRPWKFPSFLVFYRQNRGFSMAYVSFREGIEPWNGRFSSSPNSKKKSQD